MTTTTSDPNAVTHHGPLPASAATLAALEAQRKGVERRLADALHDQASWLNERSRELFRGQRFDAEGVQLQLQTMLGNDLSLLGQLQAYDYLEHPGSLSRPRSLRSPAVEP